jgi:hypothetical protein
MFWSHFKASFSLVTALDKWTALCLLIWLPSAELKWLMLRFIFEDRDTETSNIIKSGEFLCRRFYSSFLGKPLIHVAFSSWYATCSLTSKSIKTSMYSCFVTFEKNFRIFKKLGYKHYCNWCLEHFIIYLFLILITQIWEHAKSEVGANL